jgi:hypothetical protein
LHFVSDADAEIAPDRETLRRFAPAAHSAAGILIDVVAPDGRTIAPLAVTARSVR